MDVRFRARIGDIFLGYYAGEIVGGVVGIENTIAADKIADVSFENVLEAMADSSIPSGAILAPRHIGPLCWLMHTKETPNSYDALAEHLEISEEQALDVLGELKDATDYSKCFDIGRLRGNRKRGKTSFPVTRNFTDKYLKELMDADWELGLRPETVVMFDKPDQGVFGRVGQIYHLMLEYSGKEDSGIGSCFYLGVPRGKTIVRSRCLNDSSNVGKIINSLEEGIGDYFSAETIAGLIGVHDSSVLAYLGDTRESLNGTDTGDESGIIFLNCKGKFGAPNATYGLEKRTNPTYLERLVKADKRLGLRHEIVKAIGG